VRLTQYARRSDEIIVEGLSNDHPCLTCRLHQSRRRAGGVAHFAGWPGARGNSDRVVLAIVFQPDFPVGDFDAVLHLKPIFSFAIAERKDIARPLLRYGRLN